MIIFSKLRHMAKNLNAAFLEDQLSTQVNIKISVHMSGDIN